MFRLLSRGAARLVLLFTAALVILSAPAGLTDHDVLQHLNRTVAWYQHVNSVEQSTSTPQNLVTEDSVRESARRVVQLAFTFARAEAVILGNTGTSNNNASPAKGATDELQRGAAAADARVANLQAQLDRLNQEIAKAAGAKRRTLTSQREALAAYLNLAQESQTALKNVLAFASAPSGGSTGPGLIGEINDLSNSDSIAAALNTNQKATTTPSPALPSDRSEFRGLMTLISQTISLARGRMQLSSLISETDELLTNNEHLREPLRATLRQAINDGNAIANTTGAQNSQEQLQAARERLNQLAAHFKNLSNAVVPLGEEAIVLASSHAGLTELGKTLDEEYDSTLRQLAVRAGVLVLVIVVILVFSHLWHKAIHLYIREPRRRRQFMLLRRLVIMFAILLALALGFFTGFSSMATFIGFLTAGLALALQNVILSVVAYFFLIGRYGLRVGDRVTVSGVTGQVIEIGLVRFFLMELAGTGVDLHPTGRVAVWANSMIFQPYSWLKQAPGTEWVWYAVSVTVTPDADYSAARTRLTAAVESVYEGYRESIERQHATFEQSISIEISAPKPVSRLHFTESGCEIIIRYPVDSQHVSKINAQIVHRLLEELEKEPPIGLAPSGAPRTQVLA